MSRRNFKLSFLIVGISILLFGFIYMLIDMTKGTNIYELYIDIQYGSIGIIVMCSSGLLHSRDIKYTRELASMFYKFFAWLLIAVSMVMPIAAVILLAMTGQGEWGG